MAASQPAPSQLLAEIDQLIRDSIAVLRPISALYGGRWRRLCPHMLGLNKEGQVGILCYQFGGDSVTGFKLREGSGEWRCLALEKFSRVCLLNTPWQRMGIRCDSPSV